MRVWLVPTLCPCVLVIACIDRNRVNDRCQCDEPAAVIDLAKASDRRHLVNDVELAEELAIRHGDSFREREGIVEERRRREECTATLFAEIARKHNVKMAEDGTLTFEGAGRMVDLVKTKREQTLRLARRHGVTEVPVFGSMACADAGPQSDVDLLVDVGPNPSPWFSGGLVAELEELLGRRVQVVTERGLDDLLRDRVLEEAVPL